MLRQSVIAKSVMPSAKATKRLRRGKLKVAGELVDDLDGHGRHRLEGIELHAGGNTGRKHHDHGFADGAGCRHQERADDARQCRRQNDALHRFGTRGTEAERTVPQGARERQ